jgi:hypothetical protein
MSLSGGSAERSGSEIRTHISRMDLRKRTEVR